MENLVIKYFGPQLEKALPYDGVPIRRPEESDANYEKRTIDNQSYIGQKYVFYIQEDHSPGKMSMKVVKLWESEMDDFISKNTFIRFASNDIPCFSA